MSKRRSVAVVVAYIAIVALFLTCTTLGALGIRPHTISFSPGGGLGQFYEDYTELRHSGRFVVVDGMCLSACTMVVGLIPADRLCATPYAILGFHSAWFPTPIGPQHSSEGTRLVWQTYPIELRRLLVSRGWNGDPASHRTDPTANRHPELIYIAAPEIYEFIQRCPE